MKIINESINKNYYKTPTKALIHNEILGHKNILEIFNNFFLDIYKASPYDMVIIDDLVTKSFLLAPTTSSEVQ